MAKKQVVEIACDRCSRVEYRETFVTGPKGPDYTLVLTFKERTIQWADLCSSCDKAVTNYVRQMMREKPEAKEGDDGGEP